jgi:uncharacterized protein YjbI with pentapeptide repeats
MERVVWKRWVMTCVVGLFLVAVGLALLIVLFWPVADLLAQHDVRDIPAAQRGVQLRLALDSARGRILQACTGLFALGALIYTARNFSIARRQSFLAEQGQVTDRYTKAVDQIGAAEIDIRVGGIYALERVAADSARDQAVIVEVLAAFVRRHARADGERAGRGPEADVRAAMTVIARRRVTFPAGTLSGPPERIDLQATDLTSIALAGAPLAGVILNDSVLARADLRGADLTGAELARADFTGADLSGARLPDAQLREANLAHANLAEANLTGADLTGAILRSAHMPRARLTRACLSVAQLGLADLTGSDLGQAVLTKADLTGTILAGARLPNVQAAGAVLRRANLTAADLTSADLRDAQLTDADASGASMRDCCLANAALVDTRLAQTDLRGVDLTALTLPGLNLEGAVVNAEAVLPGGWCRQGERGALTRTSAAPLDRPRDRPLP